ncbi:calcium:proton antiporter [Actinocorallia populi]|uniref:calcium:proton antiporter n=1 Tax=Actinocorallia populi TaxID=2079200 RepID=UPI0018E4F874|nr:hypothetical protein [Actinocorallia populi]
MRWATVMPILAVCALALAWGRVPTGVFVFVLAILLAGAVLAAVHHAETVAHRIGEPFGALTLALAVTVIEVSLIISVMISSGEEAATLARDTAFAAVMICTTGMVGLSLLFGTIRGRTAVFNAEGAGGMLATVASLVTLTLVLPSFTTTQPGPRFTPSQLAFAAVASLVLYSLFVLTQTLRHRDYFLPVTREGEILDDREGDHADPPSGRQALISLGLLLLALVAVVGLAKTESPVIETAVRKAGLPHGVVGVVIALLVLLPETLAAVRAARRQRLQTSLNLALGSATASIGLTIPAIAIASIWVEGPLILGLGSTQLVLLVLAVGVGVSTLTVVPGRATLLQAGLHLAIFAAFLFLTFFP